MLRNKSDAEPAQPVRRHFLTLEDVLEKAQPMGRNLAREVIATDPRLPKPLFGTSGRLLFSTAQIERYFCVIEEEGFPHLSQSGGEKRVE